MYESRRPLWTAVAALTAVLALGGCGSASTDGDTSGTSAAGATAGATARARAAEPSIPSLGTATSGDPAKPVAFTGGGAVLRPDGSMTLPLDSYVSAPDETTIVLAENELAKQCMRAQGMELPASLLLTSGPEAPAPYVLYGLIDMDAAKVYGYREPSPPHRSKGGTAAAPAKVAPAVVRAYFGDPKKPGGGCEGDARKKLGGPNPTTLLMHVQELRSVSLGATYQDSRVKAAVSRWSVCMKRAGYDYADPLAPGHDRTLLGRGLPVPPGATLPPPSPAEISAAVTDITCKRRTGYLQTVVLVSAAYERELIEERARPLRAAQDEQKRKLRSAKEILRDGG
ncbi:hypothetical protein [Streptomyces sp. NPDC090025]|uniref:hypothetical protein n=1 Tax=Streptomyces sp. NPDC090025 TaxID=3365922 RepID=UPI0038330FE7